MKILFIDGRFVYIIELEFNRVNRSNFGRGSNHLYDILKNIKDKIAIYQQAQNCFLKCINFLTQKGYKNEYFEFINLEGRRKNVMTYS